MVSSPYLYRIYGGGCAEKCCGGVKKVRRKRTSALNVKGKAPIENKGMSTHTHTQNDKYQTYLRKCLKFIRVDFLRVIWGKSRD